jgi:hypothetical protein
MAGSAVGIDSKGWADVARPKFSEIELHQVVVSKQQIIAIIVIQLR